MTGRWIRLVRGNDWGHEYFTFPGRKTNDRRHALAFSPGETLRVRWPDGTEETATVCFESFHRRVGDMGHDYEFEDKVPGILASIHGVKRWVPLDEFDILYPGVSR